MEISPITLPIFYTARLFGMAPFTLTRDSKGRINGFHRNILWCVYSVCIFFGDIILIFRGILNDLKSDRPIRMQTATKRVVTCLDVGVVVITVFFGLLCGLTCVKRAKEMNRRLKEADETLSMYMDEAKDKRRGIYMLIFVLLIIGGTIGLDVLAWLRIAAKKKDEEAYENFYGYLPFYFLYFFLFIIHIQVAQTALNVAKRFARINEALKATFRETNNSKGIQIIRMASIKNNFNHDELRQKKTVEKSVSQTSNILTGKIYQSVESLAYTHDSLAKCMLLISSSFGPALLAILASCLLHLVVTAYFFLVELVGERDAVYSRVQLLWLSVHVFRLLLIVEPCHITYSEARKTTSIVCAILRNCKDPNLRDSLKAFWQQLLIQDITFSPCAMCTIDRQILTSFCGAIATYLIILMQFQKADSG